MVKVTAKGKLFNEDGIVRRLKDGKIMVRFYTYGTLYDEWLNPTDVRKLSNIEILKGLAGPSQPITQQDFDGGDRYPYGDNQRQGDMRRNVAGNLGGGPRNRRQDRVASRFRQGMSEGERAENEKNWNWYKETERQNQGGRFREDRSNPRAAKRNGDWAQRDVDSQWGRTTQRENRREKKNNFEDGGGDRGLDDWSAFVSPSSSPVTKKGTDDFFSSLMTDLSKDLSSDVDSEAKPGGRRGSNNADDQEEDFFASLMSEISDENGPKRSKSPKQDSNDDFFGSFNVDESSAQKESTRESRNKSLKTLDKSKKDSSRDSRKSTSDDFFSSLQAELGDSLGLDESRTSRDDTFFASLEADIKAPKSKKGKNKNSETSQFDDSDFFASLQSELDGAMFESDSRSRKDDRDDFLAGLENDISSELGNFGTKNSNDAPNGANQADDFFDGLELESNTVSDSQVSDDTKKPKRKKEDNASVPSVSARASFNAANLEQCTVPALKAMLKERGLKVSGKKAELIERLAAE